VDVGFLFEHSVERYPDHTALVFEERRWSYRAWHQRVQRCAQALFDLGVGSGDRVALYLQTSEVSVSAYFAVQLLGAVAVPLNYRLAAGEAAHILEDSGSSVLIYDASLCESTRKAQQLARGVREFLCYADAQTDIPAGHLDFETLLESTGDRTEPWPARSASQLSALMYTSGTTGRAKGVMHSHANDVAIAMNCVMEYGLQHQDIALHIAPLYHVGGLQAFFIPHLMVGATNVVLSRYSAASTLAAITQERITTLFAVPTQIRELLLQERLQGIEPWSLRMITTGGAALSAASMARVQRELCTQIYNGYGMTEASLTLLLHPQDALRQLGSCGKPTLISACRILAAAGEVGQLLVQGPQVTCGYWNNPHETAAKIKHGWLYTGDLFSTDEQGFYYFRGRIDDMIVSGGENIYPREVEEVLYRCAGVQQAAVIGLPDAKWGAVVTAFVVREGDLTAESLDRHCRESTELAAFKRPRRFVFLEQLPTNPSGKVLKRQLLADYGPSPDEAATI
jgi:acyl-CoA synthetase (AMP-forming)/AMP-acid ligase II